MFSSRFMIFKKFKHLKKKLVYKKLFFLEKQFFLVSRFMLFSTLKNIEKCPLTYWLNGRWFLQIVDRDNLESILGRGLHTPLVQPPPPQLNQTNFF